MTADHPAVAVAATFAAGAIGGLVFLLGCHFAGLGAVLGALDSGRDGLGVGDVLLVTWFAGDLALLVHHVMPALLRA